MRKALVIISVTLMGYLSFGQTSVAVYNNNNANYYQKMFTGKVVTFIASVENYTAMDITDDYTAILKNDADYQRTSIATDAMLVKIATNSNEEYVCNLAIKTNLAINNIVASLVNVKTGAIEQKAIVTCTDLVSAYALEKAAEDVVNKLLVNPKAEAKALAEQKAQEEKEAVAKKEREGKALAEQKAKEEKEVAAKKAIEEKALAEQKAKEEKEAAAQKAELEKQQKKDAEDPSSKIVVDGRKFFVNGNQISKKEVREKMINTDALRVFNKGVKHRIAGAVQMTLGSIAVIVGLAKPMIESRWHGDSFNVGITISSIGSAFLISGGATYGVGQKNIKRAVNAYNDNQSGKTSYLEWSFGVAPNGMSMTLKF